MNCPACGAANPDDKEFCGDCGAHLDTGEMPADQAAPADAAGAVEPEEEPSSMPDSPYVETTAIPHEQYVPTPVAPPTGTYEPPSQPPAQPAYQAPQTPPAYQQPPAQTTYSTQPAYQQPPTQPSYGTPPAAPPKKKTGLIIGIVAGVILLCILGCCITLFLIPTDDETTTTDEDTIVVEAEGERGRIEISEEEGFTDSMDALTDVADQYYRGEDWWYIEIAVEDDYEEYYITPDEATYDKGVILEQRNGEWFVTDVYTVDMSQVAVEEGTGTGEEAAASDLSDEDAAALTVDAMLVAIMEGRIDDAYALTTTPLYDYDLSVLTGEYTDWEFLGVEIQEDGSAVVIFTMYWSDGTTENVGALVLLEGGTWYVSDIGSADE